MIDIGNGEYWFIEISKFAKRENIVEYFALFSFPLNAGDKIGKVPSFQQKRLAAPVILRSASVRGLSIIFNPWWSINFPIAVSSISLVLIAPGSWFFIPTATTTHKTFYIHAASPSLPLPIGVRQDQTVGIYKLLIK